MDTRFNQFDQYIKQLEENPKLPFFEFNQSNQITLDLSKREIEGNNYQINFTGMELDRSNFRESKISEVDFSKTTWANGNFRNAKFSNVIFQEAKFYNVDFDGAEFIRGINMTNATFDPQALAKAEITQKGAITFNPHIYNANIDTPNLLVQALVIKLNELKDRDEKIEARTIQLQAIGSGAHVNSLQAQLIGVYNDNRIYHLSQPQAEEKKLALELPEPRQDLNSSPSQDLEMAINSNSNEQIPADSTFIKATSNSNSTSHPVASSPTTSSEVALIPKTFLDLDNFLRNWANKWGEKRKSSIKWIAYHDKQLQKHTIKKTFSIRKSPSKVCESPNRQLTMNVISIEELEKPLEYKDSIKSRDASIETLFPGINDKVQKILQEKLSLNINHLQFSKKANKIASTPSTDLDNASVNTLAEHNERHSLKMVNIKISIGGGLVVCCNKKVKLDLKKKKRTVNG